MPINAKGARPFAKCTSPVIATDPDDSGYYLPHLRADGTGSQHATCDEAFHRPPLR